MSSKLHSGAFQALPLKSIQPKGWLAQQLRIQADGLSGHLDEFWPDVKESRWFGGQAEGWERAPYWLDGFIPLAYLLGDEGMIAKAKKYMDFIFEHQAESGWLGPVDTDELSGKAEIPTGYDLWAELLILKVVAVFYNASSDERCIPVLEKALQCLDRLIDTRPLFNWGQFRWFEGLIAIFTVYEKTGEDWLLDLAVKLEAQGFHWGDFFKRWPCKIATPRGRWNYMSHVVNNAMAVKAHGLWWRVSGEEGDLNAVYDMLAQLERYHGMVTGMFSGDECLAGKSPVQGTELCAVNEFAYSLELLLATIGDATLGDRLEKVVYNALPATFSPDMWAHQYDQQVNQVECSTRDGRTFGTNGPDSNLYGLAPNYGCCTANLSQGWPKFAAHLWMSSEDGVAAAAYAPSQVQAKIKGKDVKVTLETEYPFREELNFKVETPKAARFTLYLRIPGWAKKARIEIGGETLLPEAGTFYALEREWKGKVEFKLRLEMEAELLHGERGTVAIGRGPLVYGLKIGEEWKQVHAGEPFLELPHGDFEVYATTPWNYGLEIDEASVKDLVFNEHPLGKQPFSPQGAPVSVKVKGKRLESWKMDRAGSASQAPSSPVRSRTILEELTLIPYGCTNLRITEFPQLENRDGR